MIDNCVIKYYSYVVPIPGILNRYFIDILAILAALKNQGLNDTEKTTIVFSRMFFRKKGGLFRSPFEFPWLILYLETDPPTPFSLSLACAAASRAIGTRKGEQLT